MTTWYLVEPEVAGELGDDSVVDTSKNPPRVDELHFVFTDWLGSQLIECFPAFIATLDFVDVADSAELTGFSTDPVDIEYSDEAHEALDVEQMPEFRWLHITGRSGEDDFWVNDEGHLVLSEKALKTIEPMLVDADITPLD